MRTKFIMHSGSHTLGGIVCSVESGNDRGIFEMESSYNPETDIPDGTVQPRRRAWVKDAIQTKMIPPIG